MRTLRILTASITAISCLLSGSAALGAGDGRGRSDDTSAPEPLFYYAFAGSSADEARFPDELVSDNLTIVYQRNFGIYPYIYNRNGEREINGGVPQRTNIAEHLREIARDIDEQIPDPEYDGYVVIDYEGWRPFWEELTERHKVLSRELVIERHPNWNEARVERKARVEFEAAAKRFLSRTLDKCRAMRPRAKWGIYAYPHASFRNNNARWLWDRHDAFFPSIYMTYSHVPDDVEPQIGEARERDYIKSKLTGRIGYAREVAGDRPVLAFIWPRYKKNNPDPFLRYQPLKQSDLLLCLERPFDYGADGVVIWENLPQPGLAEVFQEQIDNSIAPEMRRILQDRGYEINDALSSSGDDKSSDESPAETPDTDATPGDSTLSATPRGSRRGVKKKSAGRRGG